MGGDAWLLVGIAFLALFFIGHGSYMAKKNKARDEDQVA
jgi:hypothetical protein